MVRVPAIVSAAEMLDGGLDRAAKFPIHFFEPLATPLTDLRLALARGLAAKVGFTPARAVLAANLGLKRLASGTRAGMP